MSFTGKAMHTSACAPRYSLTICQEPSGIMQAVP
jgi:hypothetical protein